MNMRDELISVLMDGECTPEELDQVVAACEGSEALRQRYSRWCLIRDAMQGVRFSRAPQDFCAAVMNELEGPRTRTRRRAHISTRRWRPAAGLALAASLGALCTMAVLHWQAQGSRQNVVAAVLTTPAVAQRAGTVTVAAADAAAHPAVVREMQWGQLDADSARKLDDYVLEHSSDHAGTVMGGDAFGYARMAAQAGYDTGNGSP
jgi:negative regulator of sigma E activity